MVAGGWWCSEGRVGRVYIQPSSVRRLHFARVSPLSAGLVVCEYKLYYTQFNFAKVSKKKSFAVLFSLFSLFLFGS